MRRSIVLIMFLSSFIYSQGCDLSNLTTISKVESAQECMIGQLKDLDKYFERYEKYHESVKDTLGLLYSQEGNCKKWSDLYNATKDEDYKVSVADCNALYGKRLVQYRRVAKQYNRISIQYEKLKQKIKGLKLKRETLGQAKDLVVGGK